MCWHRQSWHPKLRACRLRVTARAAVALALDAQMLDAVPFDTGADHGDELVDVVLTPTRVTGPGHSGWK